MTRKTIKSLEADLATVRELRQGDVEHLQRQYKEIADLKAQVEYHKTNQTRLEREVTWHKQLSQNLSEAICAHMRNR